MGSRGPKPTSANVHYLKGNPSKKSAASLMDSLQPEIELPGVPAHLLPEAKKEYRRIKEELMRYGLVSKIDRAALCLYLSSWAELVYAEKMLARKMKAAQKAMEAADKTGEEYKGGDGMTEVTTNGNVIYSPWWVIANKMRGQVDKFLSNFGMSPSSRGRVSPSNHLQRDLFNDEEGGASAGGFGAI
jgi:P27 family predicted phage terminase small subunit